LRRSLSRQAKEGIAMSFFVKFHADHVEVGDTCLAAHFEVAGGSRIGCKIKSVSGKPRIILRSPDGTKSTESHVLTPEKVTEYIRDAGYEYVGVSLPRHRPQVAFDYIGDMDLLKEIAEKFGRDEVIAQCPPQRVQERMNLLKGLAVEKRRQHWETHGEKKFDEPIDIQ
jgi:hypothetical protein